MATPAAEPAPAPAPPAPAGEQHRERSPNSPRTAASSPAPPAPPPAPSGGSGELAAARRRLVAAEGRRRAAAELEGRVLQVHCALRHAELRLAARAETLGRLGAGVAQAQLALAAQGQRLQKGLRRRSRLRSAPLLAAARALRSCVPWAAPPQPPLRSLPPARSPPQPRLKRGARGEIKGVGGCKGVGG
ncbi:TMF-regulated nuclear protein 1 [Oxyura jamaicensis]|uniref:TMF-regulated nuclear protein 1 n=1 Tax=Oxyura jamaicensis TaxID=8884 RepID=UPI0015A5122E|nr:TMF-regulated nuclear protein 1 [Oxyura jamaicensis]